MDDLISRQAAIDAVCMEWCKVKHQDCKHPFDFEKYGCYWCEGCETALRTLPNLPSAQPEPIKISIKDFNKEDLERLKKEWVNTPITVLPAQPERKKGKWIKYDNGTYYCSLCRSWIPNEQRRYANYCLFCGAEMEETDG